MKLKYFNWTLRTLVVVLTVNPLPLLGAGGDRSNYVPPQKNSVASNRLIVKLKPALWTKGMSSAQIVTELMRPLTAGTLKQLQTTARMAVTESHAISNGAHIIILQGTPDRKTIAQSIANIRGLSEVEYVEEDRILTIQARPNDAAYANLWGMQPVVSADSPSPGSVGSYGADFQTAWDTTTGLNSRTGLGVVVAVIDTGITPHVDIGAVSASGNLPGYDFISDCRIRNSCPVTTADVDAIISPSVNATDLGDFLTTADCASPFFITRYAGSRIACKSSNSSWHGTHVSGIIAGIGNNNVGVIGGAYSARLLPVRVLGKDGGYLSDIAEGIRWAAGVHATIGNSNPAKVINMSLGGEGACSRTEQATIDAAIKNGAVIVVAAGNDDDDVALYSPANCKDVIVVAAIGKDGLRAAYSNYSSPATNTRNPVNVTIAAQGADKSLVDFDLGIYSTVNTSTTTPDLGSSGYAYYQGTSMAAPHVAAAAALILARNPALSPDQVKSILSLSTTAFPSSVDFARYDCATRKDCGSGILNAQFAVRNSILPYSTATAIAVTKGGRGRESGGGGGCSIMPTANNPDISLLVAIFVILAYCYRLRFSPQIGKN